MLSLIEVTCPHCAAQGQIMLPPLGAIIIGPCPECEGMVAVFCGRVLPLDKEIMTAGTISEKRGHVSAILGSFLRERVDRLFVEPEADNDAALSEALDSDAGEEEPGTELGRIDLFGNPPQAPITSEELESFRTIDLRLLDNPDYFKAIFEVD